ncbi:MAG TPA: HEAT repeat domain-containing protein [Gemmataceae bacterium]|nr:HEAT repeat domain-containing protein [Gemmataceae bacterium]
MPLFQPVGRPLWRRVLTWASLAALANCGCVGFWDEVTSHNRDLKGYFIKQDPMVVIRDSPDGAKRGRAMASLKEPLTNGGNQEQEEIYFKILKTGALQDKDPLIRLGAVKALGNCKNPRAVAILEDVIQQQLPFPAEMNTVIRQQALTSLEGTEQPEARNWLIKVARQPNATGAYVDQQQILDERLTAIRGLSKFKQSDSVYTLLYVLETEKDVALRDRANQSLEAATGKHLPPDAKLWAEVLNNPKSDLGKPPNPIERAVNWVEDWFH